MPAPSTPNSPISSNIDTTPM
ncbi:conserved hypothetical protein, partial [Trichinella spiralis]